MTAASDLARALGRMSPADAERLIRAELRKRRLLRYVQDTTPGYIAGWVHRDVCRRLERFSEAVARGENPRLMLFMPPRSGKSQIASRRLPAWHLGHHPEHEIILATYGQDLSNDLSRDALGVVKDALTREAFPGLQVSPKRDATEQWRTTAGGGMSAVGVGGPVTGRGAHMLLIDDPVKGAKEADSAIYREDQKRWYQQNARTRLAPGGGILLTMTRWHDDDLAGWLLEEAKKPDGTQWEVVRYPAIAEEDEFDEVDGHLLRHVGEALHPERYPLEALRAIERDIGPFAWASLYQQRPVPAKGHTIRAEWLVHTYPWKTPPAGGRVFISVDCANKEGELNDYSVQLVARYLESKLFLLDVWRQQVNYPELEVETLRVGKLWRPNNMLIEDKGNGTTLLQNLRQNRERTWPMLAVEPLASKALRMSAESGWLAAGDVILPDSAPWLAEFKRELLTFPKSANDDQVDALSQLLAWLRQGASGAALFRWS